MTKNLKLSERIQVLEEMGIDTSKYNLSFDGLKIDKKDLEIAKSVVENKQVDNKKLFRRWITAQTFKMLEQPSYNEKKKYAEYGWDAYLRNNYSYMYQFKMMLEEVKTLAKLEINDKEEFKERTYFFNFKVVCGTCWHYLRQLDKYIANNVDQNGFVKLERYGKVHARKVGEIFVNSLEELAREMQFTDDYGELYGLLKLFMKKMNRLPADTPKCSEWKEAFKGAGGYYSLKNLILFHDVVLRGCKDKDESMKKLTKCLNEYYFETWRFHYLLKDTIEYNNFNLRESIAKHS